MHYIAEVQGTVCLESGKHGQRNLHWRKKRMRKCLADVKAVLYFLTHVGMEETSSPSTAQSRRQLLLKASSQKSKLRPKPNGSSMVVDYYYAVQHPNEADDETGAELARGRACSFGTVLKRDGSSTKKCFVISPIGCDESEVRKQRRGNGRSRHLPSFFLDPPTRERRLQFYYIACSAQSQCRLRSIRHDHGFRPGN